MGMETNVTCCTESFRAFLKRRQNIVTGLKEKDV
jgi:hypothetical protein